MKTAALLAPLLEGFFTKRLLAQRRASPHTIASYRDSFRLLLKYAEKRLGRAPSELKLDDLHAPFVASFLDELEGRRGNGARTRNIRLAAIYSFFRYAALESFATCRRCSFRQRCSTSEWLLRDRQRI